MDILEPDYEIVFADNPAFFNQPKICEVQPVEFPIQVENEHHKRKDKGTDNETEALNASYSDEGNDRTGEKDIDDPEDKNGYFWDGKKQPMGIGFEEEHFIRKKKYRGIRLVAFFHKILIY